jgi:aminobenzoyl-glutamate transport protein
VTAAPSETSGPAPGGPGNGRAAGWLARLERAGNRLPDPASLFAAGLALVMAASALAQAAGWTVTKTVLTPGGPQTVPVTARSLLDADGLWWLVSHLVQNFVAFPPLGLVLVAMLGIGVAERSGLVPAVLRAATGGLSARWLTPVVVFLGIESSLAVDAGYVVLPPLAAALFHSAGRSPVAGAAAAFAGVAAGFSANLFITGLDPLLAGFTQSGAQVLDQGYRVAATANWWLMIASTVLLTGVGWLVTARVVEPGLAPGGPMTGAEQALPMGGALTPQERRGLRGALLALGVTAALAVAAAVIPGAPLHGPGERFPRVIEAVVPLLFFAFLVPGAVFGWLAGTVKSDRDLARLMTDTLAGLAPYLVLAFFAAQFLEAFKYSGLGEMLAVAGGQGLASLALPPVLLVTAFVAVVMLLNLLMASASAKYAFLAPVFVPMLMLAGVSPELTQAAYRVGDSVTNGVTPLNPYLILILAVVRRYLPQAGLGTLVALMLPYALAFAGAWGALLGLWVVLGWPLGPEGPLAYPPG